MPGREERWNEIGSAPFDRDIELAVINEDGENVLVFPCRRVAHGWTDAKSGLSIEIHPTHWREWRNGFCLK
ncbi:hypothetical protein [Nitratireductor sp. ZSWI3]|uniref:hypothetical protein n=1 Tax=Nitratireductor sp. ZSWI3 TaxID=2966359 RepID=UPI00214F711F|nr:hypothetical protein [Nitratireductor sp. ZSWI3]MCR4264613.1 hypothetical protein [Nitratireductor sp. ZSWI3]